MKRKREKKSGINLNLDYNLKVTLNRFISNKLIKLADQMSHSIWNSQVKKSESFERPLLALSLYLFHFEAIFIRV